MFLYFDDTLLDRIVNCLGVDDLISLDSVCKLAHERVRRYVQHYFCSFGRYQRLEAFFQHSNLLLLPAEHVFRRRLMQRNETAPVLVWAYQRYLPSGHCRRFSVESAEIFPHFPVDHYIKREFEPSLDRHVVSIKAVCWLFFNKKLGRVPPGRYVVRLRVRCHRSARWLDYSFDNENNEYWNGQLIVYSVRDEQKKQLMVATTTGFFWHGLHKSSLEESSLQLQNARLIEQKQSLESGSRWFIVELDAFEVSEECDVEFELRDITNPWWKNGIDYDFIELLWS